MKKGNVALKLIFSIMGAGYTVIGIVFLAVAIGKAGSLAAVFTLPEDDLSLAIVGSVFTLLGVVFLGVGIAFALADKRRTKLREELLAWGSRVTGTVAEVRRDHTVRVNDRSPVIATVRCPFPQGEVTLKSHRLWGHEPAVGDRVEVLFDPMDERRYVIEFPQAGT